MREKSTRFINLLLQGLAVRSSRLKVQQRENIWRENQSIETNEPFCFQSIKASGSLDMSHPDFRACFFSDIENSSVNSSSKQFLPLFDAPLSML